MSQRLTQTLLAKDGGFVAYKTFIIWVLWFFGGMIILGGALTLITGDYDLADQAWPWLLFGIAAAVMTSVQWKVGED